MISNPGGVVTNAEIKAEAVRRAQEEGRKTGFKPGQVVAHLSDEYTYYYRETDGSEAVVYLPAAKSPTLQDVVKRFPVSELFDINRVRDLAIAIRNEYFRSRDEGYLVVDL